MKVLLKSGETIQVKGGKVGTYNRSVKNVYTEEVLETTFDVKGDSKYNSQILASFRAVEVVGFTLEDEDIEEEEND